MFSIMLRLRPRSTLFPYTTLFRSELGGGRGLGCHGGPFARADAAMVSRAAPHRVHRPGLSRLLRRLRRVDPVLDRKSTRLNSSHGYISYAVFCLKKKIIMYCKILS